MKVLEVWDRWSLYPSHFIQELVALFLDKPPPAKSLPKEEDVDGEPLDGEPMDDIDGEALDGDPIDGEAGITPLAVCASWWWCAFERDVVSRISMARTWMASPWMASQSGARDQILEDCL